MLEETPPAGDAFFGDDNAPFEDAFSEKQIAGVLRLFDAPAKRVLELGCGAGRVLVPIAEAGHECFGLDYNAQFLAKCRETLTQQKAEATLLCHDFLQDWPGEIRQQNNTFDAVLCLGNTFMTVWNVQQAVTLLQRTAALLKPNGILILDAIPQEHWPEVTEGNWLSGLSEDRNTQLVWAADDAVFTVRQGAAVDADNWELTGDDQRYRLWTMGSLQLAAQLVGLSAPLWESEAGVLIFSLARG